MSICSPTAIGTAHQPCGWTEDERTEPISYADFVLLLATGSLMVEFGTSSFARIIEVFGRTKCSHVGIFDIIPGVGEWVFESVYHADCVDAFTHQKKSGVRTVYLGDRLSAVVAANNTETAKIGVIKLWCSDSNREYIADRLHTIEKNTHASYERHAAELTRAAFPRLFGQPVDNNASMFCTELVMNTLIRCGILCAHDHNHRPTPCSVNLQTLTTKIEQLPYTNAQAVSFEPRLTIYNVYPPGHTAPQASPPPSDFNPRAFSGQQGFASPAPSPPSANWSLPSFFGGQRAPPEPQQHASPPYEPQQHANPPYEPQQHACPPQQQDVGWPHAYPPQQQDFGWPHAYPPAQQDVSWSHSHPPRQQDYHPPSQQAASWSRACPPQQQANPPPQPAGSWSYAPLPSQHAQASALSASALSASALSASALSASEPALPQQYHANTGRDSAPPSSSSFPEQEYCSYAPVVLP